MARVVVVGGGYGGITVAKGLDPVADVTLIDQRSRFVHNVAALRAAVDKEWCEAVFLPYDHLLKNGRVIQGTVNRVDGKTVHLYGKPPIEGDHIVLATGSSYPFPAKHSNNDHLQALNRITELQEKLEQAGKVLIVGGGSVGLELAGEITNAYKHIDTVIVEKESQILNEQEVSPDLRNAITTQLAEMGITVFTGSPLQYNPLTPPGELGPITVETISGTEIGADIWFQCHGCQVNSDYLIGTSYHGALKHNGVLRVEPTLQVVGFTDTYAVGDLNDVLEAKRAHAAYRQARVVVANIAAQITGEHPTNTYFPPKDSTVIPLGPNFGAAQLVDALGNRSVVGAEPTSDMKGYDLLVPIIRSQLNLPSLSE